jgi:hypothetical protein
VSEQAKTIRGEAWGFTLAPDGRSLLTFQRTNPILNAHIIPGADAVVTEMGLEAGVVAARERLRVMGHPVSLAGTGVAFRTALEACGLVVVNEVMEVEGDVPGTVAELIDYGGFRLKAVNALQVGDTLYIHRADKEE